MKNLIMILTLACCLTAAAVFATGEPDMTTIFPEINGMTKGKVDLYGPDNLYEYINGAAEVFLSYDFRQLASLNYEDAQKHSLTVDIYRHSDECNGFGIYSQEKPQKGDFLYIGAQGYYEEGILNFVKGSYYVKMSAFDLGAGEKVLMTETAGKIARNLSGTTSFPLPVNSFPGRGKIKNSEKYIARNFLGHSFLHSAYIADYEEKGEKFQIFIIQAADTTGAKKIIDDYFNFAKGKKSEISVHKTFFRFLDPYYRSNGNMNIESRGQYVFGLFNDNMKRVYYYLNRVRDNLGKLHSSL